MDKLATTALVNAITARASIEALKDVLLETKEQKELYDKKLHSYIKDFISQEYHHTGLSEQFVRKILQDLPQTQKT